MSAENGSSNGKARLDDGKVRVAIVGVGNCANSLLQGREYYKDAPDDQFVPGLMHVNLGGYHVRDIEFTAAFDVVKGKVGEDLADAMWAHPNDTIKFADVPKSGIKVSRGMTHDGLGKYLSEIVEKAPGPTDDIVGILRETNTDVVVSYLPVGSEAAAKWYAEQCLEAGVALVNCMPVFIAREDYWNKRFEEKGLPIIGDDIKSQVGATITHRVLTSLYRERGVHLDKTMQLNVGGNSDFLNMLERDRLESKKISKTNAVTSMLDYDLGAGNVHVGPSDYVPWLTDRKWAYIRMEGSGFGDVPLNMELKLEVWDSPNSAGIVIDAVRMAKLALNNGVAGSLVGPSSYFMKSPPQQIVDDEAYELTEEFIKKNARKSREEQGRSEGVGTAMETAAVPAEPGKLTPLAVLVPSLATVVVAVIALVASHSFALAVLVLVLGFAITALVGSRWYSRRLVLGTAALTLGGGALGTVFLTLWALGSALGCTQEISGWWIVGALVGAALVYLALGTFGFRAEFPLVVVTFAVILALVTMGVVLGLAPETPDPNCSS